MSLLFGTLTALVVSSTASPAIETPRSGVVAESSVDLVELNHFVDENGREVFRQVVFYDWSTRHRRFHVRGWRLIKKNSQLPKRTHAPDGHVTQWIDNGKLRRVYATQLRVTRTQQDPERVNRKFLPEDKRRPLWPK